ncbi:MAG: VWA domain-containing protein [Lentisphaeria bacterium]|nr:VWA domain-containing protein [Lentisphaeria bacterium]
MAEDLTPREEAAADAEREPVTPETETAAETAAPPETAETPAVPPETADGANKTYKFQGVVDFIFLVDVTGSMGPCIDALRDNINKFIDIMMDSTGNGSAISDWRGRVVGYRDYEYDGRTSYGWLVDNPFTRDAAVLRRQLADLTPKGGGPGVEGIPESLLDAMMTVATTGAVDPQAGESDADTNKWRQAGTSARIVIVFTDATYHPTMSIPGYEGAGLKDLYNVYKQERIKPYFFVPTDPSFIPLGRFHGANLQQCGNGQDGLLSVTQDQAAFQKLLEVLARGVTATATKQVREIL